MDLSVHRRQIEDALAYSGGSHTFEDIVEGVALGTMQYWPAPHSAVITEIIAYPQKKVLNIFLAGGSMEEIERMAPIILEWGRAQGCTSATFMGRRGWERTFLTRTGWKNTQLVVLEKDL